MTIVIEVLRKIGEGPVIGPIDLPQIHGLSTMGTGAAIMAVMFWKRDGIIAFFEIDERIANWRKHRAPGQTRRPSAVSGRTRRGTDLPAPRGVDRARIQTSVST